MTNFTWLEFLISHIIYLALGLGFAVELFALAWFLDWLCLQIKNWFWK